MTTWTILHRRSVCVTTDAPEYGPGKPVTTRKVHVVCTTCRCAGEMATQGHERLVLEEWAERNGYLIPTLVGLGETPVEMKERA